MNNFKQEKENACLHTWVIKVGDKPLKCAGCQNEVLDLMKDSYDFETAGRITMGLKKDSLT